jgi:hypothetical protein
VRRGALILLTKGLQVGPCAELTRRLGYDRPGHASRFFVFLVFRFSSSTTVVTRLVRKGRAQSNESVTDCSQVATREELASVTAVGGLGSP